MLCATELAANESLQFYGGVIFVLVSSVNMTPLSQCKEYFVVFLQKIFFRILKPFCIYMANILIIQINLAGSLTTLFYSLHFK